MNPQGVMVPDNEPPLSFAEIDKRAMLALQEIPGGLPQAIQIEQTQLIILGTIKEILRTLASLHPAEPKLLLPGGRA